MIEAMARMRIVGSKRLLEPVVERLQALGVVHLESGPVEAVDGLLERLRPDAAALRRRARLDGLRRTAHTLVLALPDTARGGGSTAGGGEDEEAIRAELEAARPEIEGLLARLRAAEEEKGVLDRYARVLDSLAPLLGQVRSGRNFEVLGLLLDVRADAAVDPVREALGEVTGQRFELFTARLDARTLAGVLLVPPELAPRVREFLWRHNVAEMRFPTSVADRPLPEAFAALALRREELPREIERMRSDLLERSRRWRERFRAHERWLENRLAVLESAVCCYQTRSTFLVYGWIPARVAAEACRAIEDGFAGCVLADRLPVRESEAREAPVALANPAWARPFEVFTRLAGLPRYGSVDPTRLLAVGFPLFFGLILGDVVYGAVLLALALWVRRRWRGVPAARDLGAVFAVSSASAMGFGFVYGEACGDLGAYVGVTPWCLHRGEAFTPLLLGALGIGLAHVLFGLGLGVWTAWKGGERSELAAKGLGLGFLIGVVVAVASVAGVLGSGWVWAGGAAAAAGTVGLAFVGAVPAVRELHNAVNVLSYLRLAGIGTASVALAHAANTLSSLTGSVVLGFLVGLFFHGLNVAFGLLSPTIQSLRLHYVEFFDNFFQPGGREYRPFCRS